MSSEPIARTDEEINAAVRCLLDAEYLATGEQNLVLLADGRCNVYVIPSVMTEEMIEEDDNRQTGQIEYQVSDGLTGDRSTSLDVYTYREAVELFNLIVQKGWKNYNK